MTASILFGAAITHHTAGRLAEAEALYRRILEIDPNNAGACNNLGLILAPIQAEPLFRRAIELKSDYVDALTNLGNLYLNRGELGEATECFKTALTFSPDSSASRSGLERIDEALKSGR